MAANTPNSANSKLAASSNTTKLVKVNGFFMFMEARRQAVLAAGYKLRRGRAELSQLLSDEWEVLEKIILFTLFFFRLSFL